MLTAEVQEGASSEISAEAVREQLQALIQDPAFRSSKRSVQFLRYVVERTLDGSADQIKERTIGIEVFGRDPSYDTNLDHVVRTAAIELRKRLAIYYGDERHRAELHIGLVPGSYIPRFTWPVHGADAEAGHEHAHGVFPIVATVEEMSAQAHPVEQPLAPKRRVAVWAAALAVLLIVAIVGYEFRPRSAQDLFWKPILDTPGFVLLAVGDVPNGPPTPSENAGDQGASLPMVQHKATSSSVPFADAVTIARVMGTLESRGKRVVIRQEGVSSFSDL